MNLDEFNRQMARRLFLDEEADGPDDSSDEDEEASMSDLEFINDSETD